MQKKSIISDLDILEQLPPKVELRLLVSRLSHYKQPRKKVFDLAKKGYVELIARGHYLNLRSKELKQLPVENIANALLFPSYVSAEWALQHYGLLMDRVHIVTSVTPRKSIRFKTSLGNFEFQHLHKHRYAFGYTLDSSSNFLIARPEKALLDYLKLRGHIMTWQSRGEMEEYFSENLRIHLQLFFEQTSTENIRELLPHYHRNAKEARILKWLLARKESAGGDPN